MQGEDTLQGSGEVVDLCTAQVYPILSAVRNSHQAKRQSNSDTSIETHKQALQFMLTGQKACLKETSAGG